MTSTAFRLRFCSCTRGIVLAGLLASAMPLAAHPPADGSAFVQSALAAGLVDHGIAVIDVRSAEEIAENGRVADATHIVHTDTSAIADYLGPPPGRPAVLYCRSGRRVGLAIDELEAMGYDSLVNAGGQTDLQAALDARNGTHSHLEDS